MQMLLMIVIVGAAAGFLATRFMRLQTDVPTTIVIGIVGALVGTLALRLLVAITGWLAMFAGAVLGAMLVIWLWRTFVRR
ncbi:MAG: GlsB/YeaQ/YmgE family stress response membrane protein [Rhodobacter sp.]|nr:GlsB/YeaQ/YmgE family stress response membrane protein [Rhodobacter sp.]